MFRTLALFSLLALPLAAQQAVTFAPVDVAGLSVMHATVTAHGVPLDVVLLPGGSVLVLAFGNGVGGLEVLAHADGGKSESTAGATLCWASPPGDDGMSVITSQHMTATGHGLGAAVAAFKAAVADKLASGATMVPCATGKG